jgi:hypothetical protein
METTLTFPEKDHDLGNRTICWNRADLGFTITSNQQNPITGPFGNTCEEDEVSPEVAIGRL